MHLACGDGAHKLNRLMSVDESTRKLAAILAANILSYTVRRESDERPQSFPGALPVGVNWALARLAR